MKGCNATRRCSSSRYVRLAMAVTFVLQVSACSEDPEIPWILPDTTEVPPDISGDAGGVDTSIEDTSEPVDAADTSVGGDTAGPLEPDAVITPLRGRLRWKRMAAFARDLAFALGLPLGQTCLELGVADCFSVHALSLGAASPFERAIYEPSASPQITTTAATDRIVFTACINRVDSDTSGAPVVFTNLDLVAQSADEDALIADANILYQRFHARDALEAELELIRTLAVDDSGAPVTARDAAILTCFAVGSTTEAFLY